MRSAALKIEDLDDDQDDTVVWLETPAVAPPAPAADTADSEFARLVRRESATRSLGC